MDRRRRPRARRELYIDAFRGLMALLMLQGHLFDTLLYRPALRWSLRAAGVARRLQSGSLRLYLGYLVALVLVLLAIVRSGVLT